MKIAILLGFFMTSLTVFSQIQIGGETDEPKKEEKKKEAKPEKIKPVNENSGSTEIFINGNWSATNRNLVKNDNIFGDSIGERANETGVNAWSFGLGIRTRIHKYLLFEGGVSYLKNGEQYSFSGTDTSFSYTNNYQYIGMPLKIYFVYGQNKLRFQAGVGAIPQMALKFKRTTEYTTTQGDSESGTLKTKIGYNSFVFSFVANVGAQYEFLPSWSIYLQPEYRVQLTSSYLKANAYKHFGNALGLSFGFVKTI